MKKFMEKQIQEALKYKWDKGVRIGHDPGQEAISEWIQNYAAKYREEYDKCVARIVKAVSKATEKRIKGICPTCDKTDQLSKIVVEEFTKIWFLEMTGEHDEHVDEI